MIIYLSLINAAALLLMFLDKQFAKKNSRRIPESTLMLSGILGGSIGALAGMYLVGMTSTFFQSYLMVGVTQGIQKTIRDEMFAKMQRLPIRYFDQHINNVLGPYALYCCTSNVTDSFNRITCQEVLNCGFYLLEAFVPLLIVLDKGDGE